MNCLDYFKALSDITRVRIYHVLLDHELSVNELVALLGMGQSRVSHHVKILLDSGLLACRRSGVWSFYSADRSPAVQAFSEAARSLFDGEPELSGDMDNAEKIIGQRSISTRQFFNTIAPKWDGLKKDILGSFDLNGALTAGVEKICVAADLGCGTGELLEYLMPLADRVIGVDSSQQMLEEARKRFSGEYGGADLRLGELEHLPMKDGEADLAVISLALHHLSEPQDALKEAFRILNEGGRLIVAEFDRHENETLRKNYGDRWLGLSKEDLYGWLARCGFTPFAVTSHPLRKSLVLNIFDSKKTP
jgi:ArsR family transcriptional regulator